MQRSACCERNNQRREKFHNSLTPNFCEPAPSLPRPPAVSALAFGMSSSRSRRVDDVSAISAVTAMKQAVEIAIQHNDIRLDAVRCPCHIRAGWCLC